MEDKFIIIQWPDIQEWMIEDGFEENAYLVNDEKGVEKYGSSAYFVNTLWIEEIYKRNTKIGMYVNELMNEKFVNVPNEDIDKFVETCKQMGVTCNGGAFDMNNNGNVVGQYFYL